MHYTISRFFGRKEKSRTRRDFPFFLTKLFTLLSCLACSLLYRLLCCLLDSFLCGLLHCLALFRGHDGCELGLVDMSTRSYVKKFSCINVSTKYYCAEKIFYVCKKKFVWITFTKL